MLEPIGLWKLFVFLRQNNIFTDPCGGNSLLTEWFGSHLWLGAAMGMNILDDTASGINTLCSSTSNVKYMFWGHVVPSTFLFSLRAKTVPCMASPPSSVCEWWMRSNIVKCFGNWWGRKRCREVSHNYLIFSARLNSYFSLDRQSGCDF